MRRQTFPWAATYRVGFSAFVLSVLVGLPAAGVRADDLYWDNVGGGLSAYNNANFWSLDAALTMPAGAAPGATDNAFFGVDATYSVILGGSSAAANVTVSDGDVEFLDVGGSMLSNGGFVTIDDPLAAGLGDGARVTLNSANWDSVGDAIVGDAGFGSFSLNSGGDFLSEDIFIGNQLGSVGEANVDGAGTTLQTDGLNDANGFHIGEAGTGTLNVTGGGLARIVNDVTGGIANFELGFLADGEGTLNISGSPSQVIAEDVIVGRSGTGHLNITAGGVLNQNIGASPDAFVALNADSSGDVTVNGDGSEWLMARLEIGNLGAATLSVEAGGLVRSNSNDMTLADAGGSGHVAVFGSGMDDSTLQVTNDLYVGSAGLGVLHVGQDLMGNADGNGSLVVGSDLFVGNNSGNDLDNKVIVDGANATANVSGVTFVGNLGTGTLSISGGGRFNTASLSVGNNSNGDGTITVDGTGSMLVPSTDNAGDVYIGGGSGLNGGTGLVTIQNGGQLFDPGAPLVDEMFLGGNTNGDGTLTVTGPTSAVNGADGGLNETLTVGYTGRGVLNIEDGGTVRYELVRVGESSSSTEATINVTGKNVGADKPSQLNVDGSLTVGVGRPATMTVSGGATVDSNTSDDGAQVATIGVGAFSESGSAAPTVTVTGNGSRWRHHDAALIVAGSGGSAAQRVLLEVVDGGNVQAEQVIIGQLDNGAVGGDDRSHGRVHVSGGGSTLLVQDVGSATFGNLRVGDHGDGVLDIDGGGVVTAGLVEIANDVDSDGAVNVDGAGSLLEGTAFSVGDEIVAIGIVNITDGGTVRSSGVMNLGEQSSSSNGVVIVGTNAGGDEIATADVSGNLNVGGNDGGNAGNGTLFVRTTGLATIGGTLRIYEDGTVNLDGGTIEAADLALVFGGAEDPELNFNSGTFRFTGNKTIVAQTLTDLIGGSTLTGNREIAVVGTATLNTPLRLHDVNATLSVGNISTASVANFDFDAGTFNLTSANLTVGVGGLFGDVLNIEADQTVNVTQTATVDLDAELIVVGGFSSGGLTNNGDTAFIDTTGGGKTVDGTIVNNNNITLIGDITFNDAVSGPGNYYGPGQAHFNSGLSPGASPAEVSFEGDVVLADTNTLFIEIAGPTLGDDYDSLTIDGLADLDGLLSVSLDNFTPALGQDFTVLSASNITDNGLLLGGPAASAFQLFVDSSSVSLLAISGLAGDYNNDGKVNAADYTVYRNALAGIGGAELLNEGVTPGVVTIEDYDFWKAHYGDTIFSGSSLTDGAANVPEPATLVLSILSLVGVLAVPCRALRQRRGA